ncbi:MAG TPA: nuclear transport factor 2 family protein [Casimicrobiaceae bacterium]|nr:nuclear transport factor 2 family protein [Casimicrobiaceae bacterium]
MTGRCVQRAGAALAVVALAAATPGQAQPSARVPTVTRLVKLFSELETRLVDSAHAGDASALDAMLDANFELRVGDAPGTPVPRDEWLRLARASGETQPRLSQMAVHGFGDLATVSFADAATKPPRFIVDVWKRDGDRWKLAVRYQSEVTATKAGVRKAPRIDKKY